MADKLKLADPKGDADLDKTVIALELEEHQKRIRQMEKNVADLQKLLDDKKKVDAANRQAKSANNRIGARKDASFKAISSAPSINKTPIGRAMVPVPYPVVQDLSSSIKASRSVRFNGKPAYLLDQSTQPSCTGDAPGTGKGVRSGTVSGEVKPVKGSRTVRIEGKSVVREGDACTMNGGNNPGIYVTSSAPGCGIQNGRVDADTDPPIQAQTPEEKNWLSEWWDKTRYEVGEAVAHPWEAMKGAGKGIANIPSEIGEMVAKGAALQNAGDLEQAAALQGLFGQAKSAQRLAESAQEIRQGADAIELPKLKMSNPAQRGGDEIVTGASLLAGGAGILKGGIKGVSTLGKTAVVEGEAARSLTGGGKVLRGEQSLVEGEKSIGVTAEAEKGTTAVKVPDQQFHPGGDGVKILKQSSAQFFSEKPNFGKNGTFAAEKRFLFNEEGSQLRGKNGKFVNTLEHDLPDPTNLGRAELRQAGDGRWKIFGLGEPRTPKGTYNLIR